MTRDELLEKIDSYFLGEKSNAIAMLNFGDALRAVVELHKPGEVEGTCKACEFSEFSDSFNCPTIQAIEKELG